jgi:hypothetical protein
MQRAIDEDVRLWGQDTGGEGNESNAVLTARQSSNIPSTKSEVLQRLRRAVWLRASSYCDALPRGNISNITRAQRARYKKTLLYINHFLFCAASKLFESSPQFRPPIQSRGKSAQHRETASRRQHR